MQEISERHAAQRLSRNKQRIGVLQLETGELSESLSINPLIQA